MDMTEFSVDIAKEEGLIKVTINRVDYYLECQTRWETFYSDDVAKKQNFLSKKMVTNKKCWKCGKKITEEDGVINLPVFDEILNIYKVENHDFNKKMKIFVKLYAEEEEPIKKMIKNKEIKKQFDCGIKRILLEEFKYEDYTCVKCDQV